MRIIETKNSSNISKIEYDDKDLYVTFKTGGQYRYEDVPEKLFEELLDEDPNRSVGKWFFAKIKGHYRYKRLK